MIHEDALYLTASEKVSSNCNKFVYFKGAINSKNINFQKYIIDDNCYGKIQSGRIQYSKLLDGMLISSGADILLQEDQSDPKPQDPKSLMGKILLIDKQHNKKTIFSSGHRNILGMIAFENLIIATENGPKGGDEINKIRFGKNYGWPISSYGEKYKSLDNNKINYNKSHYDNGFEEPIYSFIPSIGISEIIKLDNKFLKFWQNNFLIGSLNYNHLLRVNFDNDFTKVNYIESIYIGERIRDIKYLGREGLILLALENSGSIGILKKK